MRIIRTLGAVALLATGAVHLQQYAGDGYAHIHVIGPLFLLNFIGAGVLAGVMLAPGLPEGVAKLAALGGVLLAAGSIVGLLVSEHTALFGWREDGYRGPIVFALVAEAATVALL